MSAQPPISHLDTLHRGERGTFIPTMARQGHIYPSPSLGTTLLAIAISIMVGALLDEIDTKFSIFCTTPTTFVHH